ncbi:ABC transporter substrate-binding protein [Kurthia sibirica]|uniref:Iron siderophore-binding protein n=1 Tax=Kurthia sibirica TaxID=202750 RepID=A0A2U3AIJ8_9BACL|nr:iron-siderophore ABC transporter substrate-binding protein [Kurthia sibirica]PWI24304.1 iron siderophore-binding protein [Kurthia sibirica]GEK35422.1 putative siderophore-binding lipoprotein YfiY [Kurthia sibirica]
MSNFKKLFTLLLTSITLIVLAACGNSSKETSDHKTEAAKTIKHAMGTADIKGTPKRVVVLTNEGTEAVLALGIKPVGAAKSYEGDPWYDHIKEQMGDAVVIGTESEISIEKIASLKPDLIIGTKMRQEKDYDKLKKIAPTVFSETLRGDFKSNFELYSRALNKEAEGKQLLKNYDDKVATTKKALGDQTKQQVSVVRFMTDKSRIYYTDSFSGVIFEQLGFPRVPEQEKFFKDNDKLGKLAVDLGKEAIPDMNGDVLFYFTFMPTGDDSALTTEKEWTADPLWKNLDVVKKGNVHKVDDAIWNTSGGILSANIVVDEIKEIFSK